jgi:hypothetical protein
MAKRKAARRGRPASGPAKRARRATPARKTRPRAARKAASAKRTARPSSRKRVVRAETKAAKTSRPKATAAKSVPKLVKAAKAKSVSAKAPLGRTKAAKPTPAKRRVSAKPPVRPVAKKAAPKPVAQTARKTPAAPVQKLLSPELAKRKHVLDLGRDRRRIQDEDDPISQTPPSSLGLDRTASAARSGRQELRDRYENHTETSPALTGGDVDADWESAYSVGDEAPGGDNPTPDQSVVDDIGAAVGVEYDDNEELEGADKIVERDRHRWEFDPASSDDFDER